MYCKTCGEFMEYVGTILDTPGRPDMEVQWCPRCGTIVRWLENRDPRDDDWDVPERVDDT